ncbi:MAG: hypothetical protein U0234_18825 [Sandaracinus sp.]
MRLALALVAALWLAQPATTAAQGRTIELDLAHGAVLRDDAPEAIAHVPEGVDARAPVALVLLLHGYTGCTRVLVSSASDARCRPRDRPEAGFGWGAAHDAAGTRSVLLVPQLAFHVRDGSPERFRIAGEAARMVDEALAALAPTLGATLTHETVASITLAGHSAAFETMLAILRHGGLGDRVRHVVLFDALYAGGSTFLDWASGGTEASPRTLVSLATRGTTLSRTQALYQDAHRRWPDATFDSWPVALPAGPRAIVLAPVSGVPHHDVPARLLAETLRGLGLPRR